MATRAYQRRDLPDGYTDALTKLMSELREGADDVQRGSQSRDQAERYHAAIDAKRLMNRAAETLSRLAGHGGQ